MSTSIPKITYQLHRETEIPSELIQDAPSTGPFDEYADYILSRYHVDVTLEDSIAYLKRIGAWQADELQDLELNKAKLLWISILDCKEQQTTYWHMGD